MEAIHRTFVIGRFTKHSRRFVILDVKPAAPPLHGPWDLRGVVAR